MSEQYVVATTQNIPVLGCCSLCEDLVKILLRVKLYDAIRTLLNVKAVEVA